MPTSLILSCLLVFPLQKPPVDAKAQLAFEAVQQKLAKANSARATLEVRLFGRQDVYEYRFLRPNFAKIISPESVIFQDGKRFFDYNPADREYIERTAPESGLPTGTAFSLGGLVGLEGLGFSNEPKWLATSVARRSYSNVPADAIALRNPTDPALKATLWVDAVSGMPIGWEYELRDFKAAGRIRNLEFGIALRPADFAWLPPKNAKKIG